MHPAWTVPVWLAVILCDFSVHPLREPRSETYGALSGAGIGVAGCYAATLRDLNNRVLFSIFVAGPRCGVASN